MKHRVLITGVQGFVGRHLLAHWARIDPSSEILGLGRSVPRPDTFTHSVHWGKQSFLAPVPDALRVSNFDYISLNILQKSALVDVLRDFRPDVVVHLAAPLPGSEAERLFRTHVEGTLALTEAIAESRLEIHKLVIASSSAVYGAPRDNDLPLKESGLCSPIDDYGASKLAAEQASRTIVQKRRIPTLWVRTFNAVGAGQHETHLFGMVARSIASIRKGISPPSVRIGSLDATRDYVDVEDVAIGFKLLAERGHPDTVYNLASGTETSARTIVELFSTLADLRGIRIEEAGNAPRIRRHFASVERIDSLGFKPSHTLEDSAADALDYYLNQVADAARIAVTK